MSLIAIILLALLGFAVVTAVVVGLVVLVLVLTRKKDLTSEKLSKDTPTT